VKGGTKDNMEKCLKNRCPGFEDLENIPEPIIKDFENITPEEGAEVKEYLAKMDPKRVKAGMECIEKNMESCKEVYGAEHSVSSLRTKYE